MSRFCKDCQHRALEPWSSAWLCVRPIGDVPDLVTGKPPKLKAYPREERKPGKTLFTRRERCGSEGKFFKPYGG